MSRLQPHNDKAETQAKAPKTKFDKFLFVAEMVTVGLIVVVAVIIFIVKPESSELITEWIQEPLIATLLLVLSLLSFRKKEKLISYVSLGVSLFLFVSWISEKLM